MYLTNNAIDHLAYSIIHIIVEDRLCQFIRLSKTINQVTLYIHSSKLRLQTTVFSTFSCILNLHILQFLFITLKYFIIFYECSFQLLSLNSSLALFIFNLFIVTKWLILTGSVLCHFLLSPSLCLLFSSLSLLYSPCSACCLILLDSDLFFSLAVTSIPTSRTISQE